MFSSDILIALISHYDKAADVIKGRQIPEIPELPVFM